MVRRIFFFNLIMLIVSLTLSGITAYMGVYRDWYLVADLFQIGVTAFTGIFWILSGE